MKRYLCVLLSVHGQMVQSIYIDQHTLTHGKAKVAECSVSDMKAFCLKTASTSGVRKDWHHHCHKMRTCQLPCKSIAMHVNSNLG